MNPDLLPIVVGVGQVTEKQDDFLTASSPLDLMEQATDLALADAGLNRDHLKQLDEAAVVKGFREPTPNSPESLLRRLGAQQAKGWLMPDGGNGPQYLVNRYFEAIAQGKHQLVLLSGSEAMNTSRQIVKSGAKPQWREAPEHAADMLVADKPMSMEHEQNHGIWAPSSIYALFENALRGHYGETIEQHQQVMGDLFAKFTDVAAQVSTSWYPQRRSAQEIATATTSNRYVGWPYTKLMNAMNQINQSASLLLCSVGYAKAQGISEDKWVYLHGCADASERWYFTDRVNYFSSPAIKTIGQESFAMAGLNIDDMAHFDIYSCFPSAVQIARDELAISKDDKRPLTITGGLPFHGGAGNNYVMNSIATMIDTVRANSGDYGLVTANGGYLTKHSAGIYSTQPNQQAWQRKAPSTYQSRIDDLESPELVTQPEGDAVIETYTVNFGRDSQPNSGIVVGRLGDGSNPMAPRFISNTPKDRDLLNAMTKQDFLGAKGRVSAGKLNLFSPA